MRSVSFGAAVVIAGWLFGGQTARADDAASTWLDAHGNVWTHHAVTTTVADAQRDFDQGLTLLYAYNRTAARGAFTSASKTDPRLAMAWWGIAMSYGPNINVAPTIDDDRSAASALHTAVTLQRYASQEERDFISALSSRYSDAASPDFGALSRAYNDAMRALARRYPDDLDAQNLFAESGLDVKPWAQYTPAGEPAGGTAEIVATLEAALARDPASLGANHFYIHATEGSNSPERALPSATRLAAMPFAAAAGHLVHMAGHTFVRSGFYREAIAVDERTESLFDQMNVPAGPRRVHNLTILGNAYATIGHWADTRVVATKLLAGGGMTPAIGLLCRFGRWSDILAIHEAAPTEDDRLQNAMWHYARSLAFASRSDLVRARAERDALAGMVSKNSGEAAVALDVVDARLARARADADQEITLLRAAVAKEDGLNYGEPPFWYYPVRESLGAALLRHGDALIAESVFRADLVRTPRNARSLFGLMRSLEAQSRAGDAAYVREQFNAAWAGADTTLSVDDL